MSDMIRRTFVKQSLAAGAMLGLSPFTKVVGANEDIGVAVVGFRSQGRNHIKWLRELPGVRIVALCDPDSDVLNRELANFDSSDNVKGYSDVRQLLENKDVDAITTATPNHWHALVTVWACQAGKDVYCEKPLCHNLWEGRQMVNASRHYNRIVQFGNQNHGHKTGELHLHKEEIGKIYAAYNSLHRKREGIGKVKGPQPIPSSVDYNLWIGPAPLEPLRRERFHYDWHWVWSTGNGEIGNNGIYQLDECRLALGINTFPKRVMSLGGRYLFNDDGVTPNTQVVLYDYDPGPLVIFELRNLDQKDGPELPGKKVFGENGTSSYPKWDGEIGDTGDYSGHQGHIYNFLEAVRSRDRNDQRADVLEGHLSTALVHLANISYRLGTQTKIDQVKEEIVDHGSEAVETFERFKSHLEANGVDWSISEVVLGPWLDFDPETEQFVGNGDLTFWANQLARGHYREPFVVPEIL